MSAARLARRRSHRGLLLPLCLGALLLIPAGGSSPLAASTDGPPESGRKAVSRSSSSQSSGGRANVGGSRGSAAQSGKTQAGSRRSGGSVRSTRPSGDRSGVTTAGPRRSPSRPGGDFHRHYRPHYYGSFGFWYGYRYPYFYPYYYPYYYGYYGRPYPAYYNYRASLDMGAVDLNVKPKKTDVYLEGQLIGRCGEFDGFPGYLWLEEGTYDLVFYRDGFETVHQRVKIFPGVVSEVDFDMRPGESLPVEQVMPPPPEPAVARNDDGYRAPPRRERAAATTDPGRLHFSVDPPDASVYLDGRFLGTGQELARLRAGLMVNPGEHRLAILHPEFTSEEMTLSVEPGEDVDLAVTLAR
jgi:hypothetical protein